MVQVTKLIGDNNGGTIPTYFTFDGTAYTPVVGSPYASPDGRSVTVVSNGAVLFSDDFGGSAVDTVLRWDVIDGGLPANPTLHGQTLIQGKIGSGITGITDAVAGSSLTVTMGTTLGAERWYLSQQAFAGAEDLLVIAQKTGTAVAAHSIWFGLVEVDPTTLIPLLNPNIAADGNGSSYFTNMGGLELGQTAVAAAYSANAIGDSSSAIATGGVGTAVAATSAMSEYLVEYHSEDVIVSNATVDSAAAKASAPSRVSTQVPNDAKVYKLLMRFRNLTTPGVSITVVVARVMLWDSQEMRVEVASGRGDSNGQKAVAVNVANNSGATPFYTRSISLTGTTEIAPGRIVTGTTGSLKGAAGLLYTYDLFNAAAATRYVQLYNSTSTTFGSQGTPIATIALAAGASKVLSNDLGFWHATGITWAITSDAAGSSQAGVASGDIIGTVGYA